MPETRSAFFEYLRGGDSILSDQEPTLGKILQWKAGHNVARLELEPNRMIAERPYQCLLRKDIVGMKLMEFQRNYLLCKIQKFTLVGHVSTPRTGSLYMATWHKTYVNGPYGRHISPRCDGSDIYCVVLNDLVVYRPHLYAEVAAHAPETSGPVHSHLLSAI